MKVLRARLYDMQRRRAQELESQLRQGQVRNLDFIARCCLSVFFSVMNPYNAEPSFRVHAGWFRGQIRKNPHL